MNGLLVDGEYRPDKLKNGGSIRFEDLPRPPVAVLTQLPHE
jgi:hypothetical protein